MKSADKQLDMVIDIISFAFLLHIVPNSTMK